MKIINSFYELDVQEIQSIYENWFSTSYKQLSSMMSVPLSTSITTNEYIDSINSEFSFQLAEMTVFQFPNSDQRKFYDPLLLKKFHWQIASGNHSFHITRTLTVGVIQ